MATMSVHEAIADDECNACWFLRKLKCSQCKNKYTDPHCFPKCQHSFCRFPCFTKLLDGLVPGDLVQCPDCNNKYPVPENGVEGFPVNHALTGLLDVRPQEVTNYTTVHQEREHVKCRGFRPSMKKKVDELRKKALLRKHGDRIELAKAGKLDLGYNDTAAQENTGKTERDCTLENTKERASQQCAQARIQNTGVAMDVSVGSSVKTDIKSAQFTTDNSAMHKNGTVTNGATVDTPKPTADTATKSKKKTRNKKGKTRCTGCKKMTQTEPCDDCSGRMCQKCMSEHAETFLFEVINKPDGGKDLIPLADPDEVLASCPKIEHSSPSDAPQIDQKMLQNKLSVEAIKRVLNPVEVNVLDYIMRYVGCEAQPFEIFLVASTILRKDVTTFKKNAREIIRRAAEFSREEQIQTLLRLQAECFKYLYVIDQIQGDTCMKPDKIKLDETVINAIVTKIESTMVKLRINSDVFHRQLKYIEKLKTFQLVTLYDPAKESVSKLMRRLRSVKTPLDKTDLGEECSAAAEQKKMKIPSFQYINNDCHIDAVWDHQGIDVVISKGLGGTKENPFAISKHSDPIDDIYRQTVENVARVPEDDQIIRLEDYGVSYATQDEEKASSKTTTHHVHVRLNIRATGTPEQLKNLAEVIEQEAIEMNKLEDVEVTRTEARISNLKPNTPEKVSSTRETPLPKNTETVNCECSNEKSDGEPKKTNGSVKTTAECAEEPSAVDIQGVLKQFNEVFPGPNTHDTIPQLLASSQIAEIAKNHPELLQKMKEATGERDREEQAARQSNKYGKCRPKPLSEKPIIVENAGLKLIGCPLGHMENGKFIPSLDDFEPPNLQNKGKKHWPSRWPEGVRPKDASPSPKKSGSKKSPTREGESAKPKNPAPEQKVEDRSPKVKSENSPSSVEESVPPKATPAKLGLIQWFYLPSETRPVENGSMSSDGFPLNEYSDALASEDSPNDDIKMADILKIIDEVD